MKYTMMLALFAAVFVAVCALPFDHKVRRPPPRGGVSFPGYGSFNPRGRRSTFDERVKVDQHIGTDPNVEVDVTHQTYEGKNGHLEVYGSAAMKPHDDQPSFEAVDEMRRKLGLN